MVKVRKAPEDALRAALTQLAQAEATLVANQATFVARISETTERYQHIESLTTERYQHIESLLLRLLEVLPDALRERIGIPKK
jgi:hypothetical protein